MFYVFDCFVIRFNELQLQFSINLLTYLLPSSNNRLPVDHTSNKGNRKWKTQVGQLSLLSNLWTTVCQYLYLLLCVILLPRLVVLVVCSAFILSTIQEFQKNSVYDGHFPMSRSDWLYNCTCIMMYCMC